jgi:hypothetical protein
MRKITSLLACIVVMLVIAVPASAQTSTEDGYSGLAGQQQGGGSAGGGGGSLPFTGLELGLVALTGAGLVGVGFAVRRASRLRESTP